MFWLHHIVHNATWQILGENPQELKVLQSRSEIGKLFLPEAQWRCKQQVRHQNVQKLDFKQKQ